MRRLIKGCITIRHTISWKEGNVLFNDALNTFYLRLYGVRHMVKDHSDSEKGNPLPPHLPKRPPAPTFLQRKPLLTCVSLMSIRVFLAWPIFFMSMSACGVENPGVTSPSKRC